MNDGIEASLTAPYFHLPRGLVKVKLQVRLGVHDSVLENWPGTSKAAARQLTRGLFQRSQEAWFKVLVLNAKV